MKHAAQETKSAAAVPVDEEARTILRRIVESLAWRQLAVINILGHGLKYVTELDVKLRVVGELDRALELFQSVRALYADLGWTDIEAAVRERAEDVPYPESRLEFGIAYYVSGLTEGGRDAELRRELARAVRGDREAPRRGRGRAARADALPRVLQRAVEPPARPAAPRPLGARGRGARSGAPTRRTTRARSRCA